MNVADEQERSTEPDDGEIRCDVSVVIPVHNSDSTLSALANRVIEVFAGSGRTFEIVFVDDGSRNQSWVVLQELQARHYGQHNALMCGTRFASGMFVVTMDDDLQNPPSEIPKLLSAIESQPLDVVYGRYQSKKHNQGRNVGSALVTFFFRTIFRQSVTPTSFRIITRQLTRAMLSYDLNFTYIDGLIAWNTTRVGAVAVEHEPRVSGRSGYSVGKLLLLSLNLFTNFSLLPLQMASLVGAVAAVSGLAVGLYYIFLYLLTSIAVPGFASTIVAILFLGGTQLLALGVIGEYVGRMHLNVNKKPQFTIRQILNSSDAIAEGLTQTLSRPGQDTGPPMFETSEKDVTNQADSAKRRQ